MKPSKKIERETLISSVWLKDNLVESLKNILQKLFDKEYVHTVEVQGWRKVRHLVADLVLDHMKENEKILWYEIVRMIRKLSHFKLQHSKLS